VHLTIATMCRTLTARTKMSSTAV